MSFVILLLAASLVVLCIALLHLRHKNRLLRLRGDERTTMVALLSHRLRSPLSAIKWNTDLLLEQDFGTLQPTQLEMVRDVSAGIDNAISVLNTFLSASQAERGLAMSPVKIDLQEQLDVIVDSLRIEIKKKHIDFTYRRLPQRITVFIDPMVLHTVIEVIVRNAITYTPDGGAVMLTVDDTQPMVTVRVTDSGIGISVTDQLKLFTKFYRSKRAQQMSTTGNGLGLYLAKHMLDMIGGSISCDSREGTGTTMAIRIPRE